MKMKIYLAGGWFTPEQDKLHTKIFNSINTLFFDVYNPRIEGQKITEKYNGNFNEASSEILLGNITGIEHSDAVVVIYDYKDTGTIWESGFAYASKKPIIYYSETNGNKPFNLMLAKTGYYVTNVEDLMKLLNEFYNGILKFSDVYHSFDGEIE